MSRADLANAITWKNLSPVSREPGTAIPGSRQTGLARLSCNCEVDFCRSVAALVSCYCLVIVAAVIVLGLGALFLLFVVLFTLRVSSHSCETVRQLLHHPIFVAFNKRAEIPAN